VTNGDAPSENGQRKRRSRWGASDTKINIPGLPTAISSAMTKEQREQYSGECLNFRALISLMFSLLTL
jgi:hypothetical protein